MRGVTCDGCNLKYLFDGSRPCPRCGTLPSPFEATNEARPAAQASPFGERAGGVVIGLMGAGMLAANVAAAHFANRYYPAIAVLGGACVGAGGWQALVGGDYRTPGAAPTWKRMGLGASAITGFALAALWMWGGAGE